MIEVLGAFVFLLLGMALGWRVAQGRWPCVSAASPLGATAHHVKQIFEYATDGLFLVEVLEPQRFRHLAVNPALLQLIGMRAEQLVGHLVHETGVPAEAAGLVARLRRCVETAAVHCDQITLELPAGRRVVELTLVPLRDATGHVHQLVGIVHDLTERMAQQDELAHSRAQLQHLTASLVSRELHEELGQVLTALRLSAGMLRVQYADSLPPLLGVSNAMTDLVDRAVATLRELVRRLRPAVLDEGLLPALLGSVEQLRLRQGLACRLEVAAVPDLDGEEAVALLGVAREALGNVARHAGVSQAELALRRTGDRWEFSVRDAGRGFDPMAVGQATFGLKLMREGAHLLRGDLQITSHPGAGTEVRLSFPAQPC